MYIDNPYFIARLEQNKVTINGEEYHTVPVPPYRTRMIGTVVEEDSGYTQVVIEEKGVTMVTKINKDGSLAQTTREYQPKNGELRPPKYKDALDSLTVAFEKNYGMKLDREKFVNNQR